MASATVHAETLPLIDLNLLTQTELLSLSLFSSPTPSLSEHEVVSTPKIDRSVFNESAGSRKQTFSRLRLSNPRNNLQSPPTTSRISRYPLTEPYPLDPENSQIISHLKSLFSVKSSNRICHVDDDNLLVSVPIEYKDIVPFPSSSSVLLPLPDSVGDVFCSAMKKRKRGRPRKDDITITNDKVVVDENGAIDVSCSAVKKRKRGRPRKDEITITNDKVVVDENGAIDVSCSAGKKRKRGRPRKDEITITNDKVVVDDNGAILDFAALEEEFRRRTEGFEDNEEQLLAFLAGLRGEWRSSTNKKTKIVDASDFGHALPPGWKLLLCVRKYANRFSFACRRYISPNGQQFVSCKDVALYFHKFSRLQESSQPSTDHTYDSVWLENKSIFRNPADVLNRNGKNGAELVCSTPLPITSVPTENVEQITLLRLGSQGDVQRGDSLKCHECPLSFEGPDDLLHHLSYSHQRIAKKVRHNTSITERVIMKDGKYQCQLCGKSFKERRQCNSHLGSHVKMHMKKVEGSGLTVVEKRNGPVDEANQDVSDMQELIRIGSDSVETSNAKAKANGIICGLRSSGRKADDVVSTYAGSYEQNLLSFDKHTMEADRNDKVLVVENCDNLNGDLNVNDYKLEKVNAGTDNITAKSNFSLGAETSISKRHGLSTLCKSSDAADGLNCPIIGVNIFGWQQSPQNCYIAPSAIDQALASPNNMNGVSARSMVEQNQEKGCETLSHEIVEARSTFSTRHNMEVNNGNKFAADVPLQKNALTYVKDHSFESSSPVPSQKEQRCGYIDNMTEDLAVHQRGSNSLPPCVDLETCVSNNNLRVVSTRTVDEPKSYDFDNSGNIELTIDFGSSYATRKPCQGNDNESGWLTLFGSEQSCSNNLKKISAETVEVPEVDEARNSTELLPDVGSSDGNDTGFPANIEQESGNGGILLSSLLSHSFPLKDDRIGNSIQEYSEKCKDSESSLTKPSGNEQTFDVENNVNMVSSIAMGDPKDEVECFWNGGRYTRLDADFVTGVVHESCSKISGNDERSVSKKYIPRACGSGTAESKLKREVFMNSCREGPRLEDPANSKPRELIFDLSTHARPDEDVMSELIWKSDDENVILSGLATNSSQVLQSSGSFPTFDLLLDKGESEQFGIGEKYGNMSGLEGLRSGSPELMEYEFLTAQRNADSEDTKVLQYDAEMAQGFESSTWLQKEALPLLPKTASRHQVLTMCVWCGNECHHEAFDPGAHTGSIGFMCSNCKAKFPGQHNFL
ncbi:zf-C2H2 domain-containing protein/MBD domain-containing protein/AT_hook domain-containing protein [Cephalotus follicularis]|uniref:Zf-C2H2 domain-containing protein/MBD domain-containing protein/AT_hook domain-containing protein n=1 Tax=Cephalotus follicularis TaxID=3775 RepID=A0A1Q3B6F1_CEPFO|nr:zf-C2H2 domain-containing protein/MBD domain-containing protein/AT_hook domain-containing protein [Cephalotus follicularis]